MDQDYSSMQTIKSPSLPPETAVSPSIDRLSHSTVFQNDWTAPTDYVDYSNSNFTNAAQSTSMSTNSPGGGSNTMGHTMAGQFGAEVEMSLGEAGDDYELQPDGTSTKRRAATSPEALPSNALRAAAAYLAVAVAKRQKIKVQKEKHKLPPKVAEDRIRKATVRSIAAEAASNAMMVANYGSSNQEMMAAIQSETGSMPSLLGLSPGPEFDYSTSPFNTTLPEFNSASFDSSPISFVSPALSQSPVASGSNGSHTQDHSQLDNGSRPDVVATQKTPVVPIVPRSIPPPTASSSSSPLSSNNSRLGSPANLANAPLDQLFQFRESMFSLVPGTWLCGFCDRSVDPDANMFTFRPAVENNHGFSALGNEEVGAHLKSCDAVGEERARLMKEWRVGVKARKVQQSRYVEEVKSGEPGQNDETRRGASSGKVGGATQLVPLDETKVEEPIKPVKKMAKGWKSASLLLTEPVVKKPGRPQSKAIAKREAAAKALEEENGGETGTSAGAARLAAKRKAAAANSTVVKKIIVAGKLKAAKKSKSGSSSSDLGLSTPNFDGSVLPSHLVL